jgi:FtsH-binding integral membrane protein
MSSAVVTGCFLLYSALMGATLSLIFLRYSMESIAITFFVTALTFGVMSVYGYVTKRDLTSIGNLCFMALIGLIIASIVNMFVGSSLLYWGVTYVGILIFVGLTAYDTQKIKEMSMALGNELAASETGKKQAILGALTLYLDFINLFLLLLRIFGGNRN